MFFKKGNAPIAVYNRVEGNDLSTPLSAYDYASHMSKAPEVSGRDHEEAVVVSKPPKRDGRPRWHTAWRTVIASGALAGIIVLLVNLIALVVIYTKFDTIDDAAVIFTGDCSTTKRVTTVLHLVINVLSTVLLAYTNFSAQAISSPTRNEVDKAHSRQRWLSIGVPNVRNLFNIAPVKTILWISLVASSFPLHLLYNSVFFETQTSNQYYAASVTPDFLQGAEWTSYDRNLVDNALQTMQKLAKDNDTSMIQRLSALDCVSAYGKDVISDRRHVLLVTDAPSKAPENGSVLAVYEASGTSFTALSIFAWMCDASYDSNVFHNGGGWSCPSKLEKSIAAGQPWIPGQSRAASLRYGNQNGQAIDYCYSMRVPDECKISAVPFFLIIVTCCNFVKIIAFIVCLRISNKGQPLVTTGDAIASFLDRPDQYTTGRCLVSKNDYDTFFRKSSEWTFRPLEVADTWTGGRYRWGKAVPGWRVWMWYMLIVSTAVMLAGAFYGPDGLGAGTTGSWSSVISLGIGLPHPQFILSDDNTPVLLGFLSANTPQLIVSYLYLGLSNLLTTMLAMAEWCSYYTGSAKGLRVSSPRPNSAQRGTYFLSLPYRWAIPMTVSVTLVHYFVSEMVFYARIDVYDTRGDLDPSASSSSVFFSPLAMLLAVSTASLTMIVLICVAVLKKYPMMPLAGCCSASIAAATQPCVGEKFEEGLAREKLNWGVVRRATVVEVGHATFGKEADGGLVVNAMYR